ncbi:phosphotransferase [Sorangium sp. So ce834]|uniref:phosphotransferase enzyme family protein n=1 Tax=Sorangium sp. So ce834 TaxID=3133321 RepID=UPI003F633CEF
MQGLEANDAAARYIAERFGLGGRPERMVPVGGGEMGRVYRLDAAGAAWAVKELFRRTDEDRVARQVAFQDAAARCGIRAPANLSTVDGRHLCSLPAELGGATVRLCSWIDGHPVQTADPGLSEWVGSAIGRIHGLSYPADGADHDPWYDACPTPKRWEELIAAGDAGGADWVSAIRSRLGSLLSLADLVTPAEPTAMICWHLDLQPDNVTRERASDEYVLLDWDDSGPEMPDRVLAMALWDWHVHGDEIDIKGIQGTLAAYRRAGGHAELTGIESFTAIVASYLNYVFVQAERTLHAQLSLDRRRRAAAELQSSLANPPDPARLMSVLNVARAQI